MDSPDGGGSPNTPEGLETKIQTPIWTMKDERSGRKRADWTET